MYQTKIMDLKLFDISVYDDIDLAKIDFSNIDISEKRQLDYLEQIGTRYLINDINKYKKLEEMSIELLSSHMQFPMKLIGLVSLKKISFDESDIKTIPKQVFRLKNLEEICINKDTKIKKLPREILAMKKLKVISIPKSMFLKNKSIIKTIIKQKNCNIIINDSKTCNYEKSREFKDSICDNIKFHKSYLYFD